MSTRSIDRMAVEVEGTGDALVMLDDLRGTWNVFTPQVPSLAPAARWASSCLRRKKGERDQRAASHAPT